MNGGWGISYEIALRWMPLDITDDKSTLVQVMAWCHQATSHYLSQCWPRSMSPNVITRPQWVKSLSETMSVLPSPVYMHVNTNPGHCPGCRTYLIETRFWVVVICPIIKCLTVLEFSFLLFYLCLFITTFNFILNYVLIVTFWIFTYHKIWMLLIIYCFIWNY